MHETDFVQRTQVALELHGFAAHNTIACVGVCRDELCHTFVDEINVAWGEAFNFSSLAGMLFLGRTGFGAAHDHAPVDGGRERYLYAAMPHIGIGPGGELGVCHRPGRPGPSSACGALVAFLGELERGHVDTEMDPDDVEQGLLKARLVSRLHPGTTPSLLELTHVAREAILADLERLIGLTVETAKADYAVLSGVQIHGPDENSYVWPATLYAVVGGERCELSL
jgi:hypothetical protein